jgi:hypothetical protein
MVYLSLMKAVIQTCVNLPCGARLIVQLLRRKPRLTLYNQQRIGLGQGARLLAEAQFIAFGRRTVAIEVDCGFEFGDRDDGHVPVENDIRYAVVRGLNTGRALPHENENQRFIRLNPRSRVAHVTLHAD